MRILCGYGESISLSKAVRYPQLLVHHTILLTRNCSLNLKFSPSKALISCNKFSVASRLRRRHSRAESLFFSSLRSFFSESCFPSLVVVMSGRLLLMGRIADAVAIDGSDVAG